ncbi:sigma-70 family RNA polymerase sigma factor [candidate division GN15 bacterium]|nr:sigma-70 family RNA polymerase sigma factor [candidate division GN15 bacterium]
MGGTAMTAKRANNSKSTRRRDQDDETDVKRLVDDFKRGNQRAFTELVRRYRPQVISLAYKMTADYDEASDVAQNVFLKMAHNIWRYDPGKKFYTWLYRITVNASIDHMRKIQRHRHEPLEQIFNVPESRLNDPDYNFYRRQLRHHVSRASLKLTDKQRTAFVLRDVEGCRVTDVSRMMDMPEATVRWYLHRARAQIRKELLKRCPHILTTMGLH